MFFFPSLPATLPAKQRLTAAFPQIEQFIESIFPSQTNKQAHAVQKPKVEEAHMDTFESLVLIGAVLVVLLSVGGLMVRPSAILSSFRSALSPR